MENTINGFSTNTIDKIGYYVYRLVNPFNLQTFYVGKGKGNRCFEHAKQALKPTKKETEEDLKINTIKEIIAQGKEVIIYIHRWGILCEQTAYEVEAALMDCYFGLSNIQSGHDTERGLISAKDLEYKVTPHIYEEPSFDYILIKTKPKTVEKKGLYEAVRSAWTIKLDKAKSIKYVFAVVDGIIKGVFDVEQWTESQEKGRIEFVGKENKELSDKYMYHLIPEKYHKKGCRRSCFVVNNTKKIKK